MSWGIELWDQYDNVAAHTQKGIDFLERYGNFIRDRCAIESEYAGKLRRLVKSYMPKKKEEEEYQFSCQKAFRDVLTEVNDQAGQHEVVAENLTSAVTKEIVALVKDLKEERKKALQEGAKLQSSLSQQLSALDRAQKNYEKAFREAERAEDAYRKADADLNLSRADVEKQRINSSIKSHQCDDNKNEYAKQLQKTNELQTCHYQTALPGVFHTLQELDDKRIKQIENFIRKGVDIERSVFPIINKCLDGIIRAADSVDPEKDSRLVIERYKSGFSPPEDVPFEDLSNMRSGSVGSDSSSNGGGVGSGAIHSTISLTSSGILKSETKSGTLTAMKLKKRAGIFSIFNAGKSSLIALVEPKEDFSDLAPNQRRKKLQQRLDEINTRLLQETATRDGLMKMKGVYEQNRALGDPLSIEGQLTESGQRLDKLRLELHKFQGYLDEAEGRVASQTINAPAVRTSSAMGMNGSSGGLGLRKLVGSKGSNNALTQHGGSDESLSRSASDSSVSNPNNKPSLPGTPQPTHGSSHSPESGVGSHASHTSFPDSEVERLYANAEAEIDAEEDDTLNGSEVYESELLPVLGTCRALYAFEAQSEGSIPLHEGEELFVIEVDQGDGWTRVRRNSGFEEGFVPTSYIQCTLYNNC
ncbi:formin-binding protein 1-like isoform X1 [Daphnia carinata]|uniref:formin-binding protein 1-like isoform X1 n=1 Tax=Daphnia carinata TaxID=120202 RepID=UPI00257E8633|nr:formin-binding protein 1-like isoform X1 [Daphnia carinata]